MESLYTKYRPQTFEQVVGQTHVVETLKRAVLEGRTSHAYLFCGPRGTGKTTMARILAKALLCEKGPGALPDGTCEQCSLIAASAHPDVIELDAASRTGVDNVREEIISRVSYAPVMGRRKVYIIDEVHMLTPAAFNALLKTIEEPPEHVVFIMCTTDPQRILATILSRVQRFEFHAIGNDEMQAHLAYVCGQEGFTYDEAALELIVRHARGGMRDALTALEQLSVFGAGDISFAAAQEMLGEVSATVLSEVAGALARRDTAALFAEVAHLVDVGHDPLQFTRELAAHLRDVYVVSVAPTSDGVVAATGAELEALRAEAAAFGSPDRLARALAVLGDASSEMRTATNQRLVLEIALTRLARPETDLTLESLAERVADLERQVDILATPGALASMAPAVEKALEQLPAVSMSAAPPAAGAVIEPRPAEPAAPVAPAVPAAPAAAEVPAAPVAPAVPDEPKPSRRKQDDARFGSGSPSGSATPSQGLDDASLQRAWKRVVEQLVAKNPPKGSLLLSSDAMTDDGETLTVSLPKGSHFAARMLERPDVRELVDEVVGAVVGRRQVLYVESSLANQVISQADRAAAPPAPASVAAPQPVAAPVPAPAPSSQPAATPSPAPAPVAAPAAVSEPVDDPVPYTDADVTPYEDDAESAPAPDARPAAAPTSPADSPAAPGPAAGAAASRAASEERSDERRAGGTRGRATSDPALTPEFAAIAAQLAAAFGEPLSVSVESAATTSDEDAAAELAGAGDYSVDEGFTDEPVEDGDDD